MALIFFLSSRSSFKIADQYWLNFVFFKALHLAEYAVLTFLLFRAFVRANGFSFKKALLYSSFLALVWAMTDEFHQTFVMTRQGSIRDVLIDSLGIFAAEYFLFLIKDRENFSCFQRIIWGDQQKK